MAYSTRLWLPLAAFLCLTTAVRAQFFPGLDLPTGIYIEPECFDFSGTDFFVGTDVLASQERFVAYQPPPAGMAPDTQFFRRTLDIEQLTGLDLPGIDEPGTLIPILNLLTISVYGRLRATESFESYLMVRVNEQDWFTFRGTIAPTEDFQWIAAPARLPGLVAGTNTIDIAILQRGTQLDKIYVTAGMDVPTGKGGEAVNCDGFDFEPNMAPVAVARATPASGEAPLTVELDGSDSFDDDGRILSYDWAWEGGGSASGPTPTAIFPTAGVYNVSLTVTDDFNATDTDVVVVNVTEPTGPAVDEYWLEAECAAVGEVWQTVVTEQASANQAVAATQTDRAAVPEDVTANRVRFAVENAAAGQYSLFARINAPNGLSDSYYVRVNGGEWYSWSQGIRQGVGFRWNRYPAGMITLEAGTNFIDFAFREAGTELDKLHLNTTGEMPPAGSFGQVATNCDDAEPAATVFSLEAECALRGPGMGWQPKTTFSASNNKAMIYVGLSDKVEPVNPDPKRTLTFSIDVTEATTYYGFVRLQAPDVGSNSFWLQVDDGDYVLMRNELDGSPLLTNGYEWRPIADDGTQVTFDLGVGPHTITIVSRESNTRLDKFIFRANNLLPQGLGRPAANCTQGQPIVTLPSAKGSPADDRLGTALTSALDVYPNPTAAALTLELTSDYSGSVAVRITDFTGREVRRFSFNKAGQLREVLQLGDLAPGLYHLQTREGERLTVRPFVRQ